MTAVFSPGKYELSSVRGYVMSAAALAAAGRKTGAFQVASIGDRGNVISGSVNAPEDGWFVTTVPYDANFRIRVDGKEVAYDKVNTAFMGFPITKGSHNIVFQYTSPGFAAGVVVSLTGFLIFCLSLIAAARRAVSR
jgi:uncharacterized membrane protein YfhO